MLRLQRLVVVLTIADVFYFVWLDQLGMTPSKWEMRIGGLALAAGVLAATIDAVARQRNKEGSR